MGDRKKKEPCQIFVWEMRTPAEAKEFAKSLREEFNLSVEVRPGHMRRSYQVRATVRPSEHPNLAETLRPQRILPNR